MASFTNYEYIFSDHEVQLSANQMCFIFKFKHIYEQWYLKYFDIYYGFLNHKKIDWCQILNQQFGQMENITDDIFPVCYVH